MRVVVVGASGNVGTSVLRSLADEPAVDSVLGLARRVPRLRIAKVEWSRANVAGSDLVEHFSGADAVIHLAWQVRPARDVAALREADVGGSERVFRAVAECGVPTLVYASSASAYSPAPE